MRTTILCAVVVCLLPGCAPEPFGFGGTSGPGGGGAGGGGGSADPGTPEDRSAANEVGQGGQVPFDVADGEGVVRNDDGSLTLDDGGAAIVQPLIWVANSWEGTVSKIDTRTHVELARYLTGPGDAWTLSPSRTAVNRDGHVVVANRGYTSAMRVLAANCPDRDGDGTVRTSSSGTDVLSWGQDECIDWFTAFGNPAAIARGTVVEERGGLDGVWEEVAWVGAYAEATMYEIATAGGALTGRTVDLQGVMPYGAALAGDGKVWVSDFGAIASFDTATLAVHRYDLPAGRESYGLAVDANGDVWTGGTIQRFRPSTGQWDWPTTADAGEWGPEDYAGGVAADARGFVWAAKGMVGGGIDRIDIGSLEVRHVATGGTEHGVAPDADGMIWGIDLEGTTASIVDPDTFAVQRLTPPFNGAYTYSDMTGSQAALQSRGRGRYRHRFETCTDGSGTAVWSGLSWDARVPAGAHLDFSARTGDDPAALQPAAGVAVAHVGPDTSPVSVGAALDAAGVAAGRTLEIEVALVSDDGEHAPTLLWFGVERRCDQPLE